MTGWALSVLIYRRRWTRKCVIPLRPVLLYPLVFAIASPVSVWLGCEAYWAGFWGNGELSFLGCCLMYLGGLPAYALLWAGMEINTVAAYVAGAIGWGLIGLGVGALIELRRGSSGSDPHSSRSAKCVR